MFKIIWNQYVRQQKEDTTKLTIFVWIVSSRIQIQSFYCTMVLGNRKNHFGTCQKFLSINGLYQSEYLHEQ